MRILHLDCFSGISGDMLVGALCDLGVAPSAIEWELAKLDLGPFHTHWDRKSRQGIEGVKFGIHEGATHRHDQDEPACGHTHGAEDEQECGHTHEHEHEHGDPCGHKHGHDDPHSGVRTHADIRALIESADLSPFVRTRALSVFRRIAEAEGKIHGMSPDNVHFHEVGALDSIADIVGACAGIEALGVERVTCSPLFEGTGWIRCAHGRFPLPAPATAEILAGIPLRQIEEPFEFVTPTGAALAAEFADGFGPMPNVRILKIGYGIGTRDTPSRPNVLRAILAETVEAPSETADTIACIETNLDDQSPELTGAALEKAMAAGALDAFLTPVQMKKNRPGVILTVLCPAADANRFAALLLEETSAFGVRITEARRVKLERRFETVRTPFGEVTVKLGLRDGTVLHATPEFESCRAAAQAAGVPVRTVLAAASAAAVQGG